MPGRGQVSSVPLSGFINGLALARSGRFVAAAVGQEHRLGRWFGLKEARNCLAIVPLPVACHRKPHLLAASGESSGGDQTGGNGAESDSDAD